MLERSRICKYNRHQEGQFANLRKLGVWYAHVAIDSNQYKTPGQLLAAALEEKGWSQRVLAIVMGVDETGVNKLISGKRPFTAEVAVSLEELLGVQAEDFLRLQTEFELAKARYSTRPDPARRTRAQLFGGLPVTEMIKRGWLNAPDVRDVQAVEAALKNFFNAESLEEIEVLQHAPKKTNVDAAVTPVQLAWLYRVKQIAADMLVARYSPTSGRNAITRLSDLLGAAEETRKVPRILAECGIRFVVVESLSNAKIDGVCFWLDPQSPVIGMSLRFDRIDNFWFVLRHELEHLLEGHGQGGIVVDADLDGPQTGQDSALREEERIANRAAAEFCVPQEKLQSFIARKDPFYTERDIIGFARTINVHPGLVAGQLQRHTQRYELFRKHLAKVREWVRPSAVVDGWGDVAPVDL